MSEQKRVSPTMTTAMLKALANPLRRRILEVLSRRQFARAADVAADLGEPANKVSFHLRVLAEAGAIVEAPEQARDGRDRVWTGARNALSVGSPEAPVADEQLGTALVGVLADEHQELLRRLVGWSAEYVTGRDSATHGMFSRHGMRLTEDEFTALVEKLHAVLDEAAEARDAAAPDARFWQLDIVAADETI